MGSIAQNNLPVINFSKVEEKLERDRVRDRVMEALVEFGCFEATFDGVPMDLRESFLGSIQEIFDLPLETKMRHSSERPYHGYEVSLHENMGIDDPDVYDSVDTLTNKLWPEGHPGFSETIQSFSKGLSVLDRIIRRMVVESLGLEKYMEEHMDSTNYLLLVKKYKGMQTAEAKVRLASHTDKGIITILYQDEVGGLEVMTKAGDWIPFKTSPDSFIVMVGDSLLAWTNGRIHSPHHRVMMSGNKTRYSAGYFSVPKGKCLVKAPDEMVDEDHPRLYKPFDQIEFMRFYYKEGGQKLENPLKTYCGI